MRQFVYVGEGDAVAFGLSFPRGVPVSVDPDVHPHAVKKLAGNRFFTEILGGVEVVAAPVKRGPGRPRRADR